MTYRVIDTDTYQDEQTGEKFRLAGANAPEKHTPEGQMALNNPEFQNQLNQTEVTRLGRDHYGRTVARFTSPDGTDFGQEQISAGLVGPVDYTGGGQMYASPLARPDEYTPEQKALAGESPTPQGYSYSPPPKEKSNLQKLGAGVDRGFATARAGYFGAQSAVGNLIARDPDGAGPKTDTLAEDPKTLSLRDRFSNWMQRTGERGYMRNMQQAEQNPKTMTLQQATESGKLADYSSFAFEAMGEAIPSIIEMLGVGAVTALTGGVAGAGVGALAARGAIGAGAKAVLERSAQRALINTTRKKLIAQGVAPVQAQALSRGVVANLPKHLAQVSARRGFTAGMFGSSAGMQAGQFYKETENETGVRAPGTALLAGGAAGALDVVGFEVLLGQLLNKRIPINKALDILKPVMAGVAVGVPGEGLTEAAQEVIGVLNTEYHRKSDIPLQERMLSKENLWRYAEAGAAGAVFGGAFGGAGGAARGTYDFATRERPPVEAPTATPPTQETPPTTDTGTPAATGTPLDLSAGEVLTDQPLGEQIPDVPAEPESPPDFTPPVETESPPDFTPPAEPESPPDFTPPVEPESPPDFTPPVEPESPPDFTPPVETESPPDFTPPVETESTPDLDPGARQTPSQNPVAAPVQTPAPAPPAAKPYALDDRATPDQQRGFLFDSEEAAAQTAKDLLGPLDIPVTPRQQHEVSIAEDDSVIPGSGAFGLATPIKSNDELTVAASEGVAQDVETVPARFLADMDQARTTLGGTSQLKTALARASPSGWAKDEVVPKVLDTFETLSRALAYADDHSLKSGEYLIGRKNDGYAVVDLRGFTQSTKENATQAVKKPALSRTRVTPETFDYGIADDQTLVTDAPPPGFKGRVLSLPVRKGRVPLSLPELQGKVNGLVQHAKANPDQNFLIDTLNVPYTNKELAKLFNEAMNVENIALPLEYINYIKVFRKIGEAMRPVGGKPGPTETGIPTSEQNQGVSASPEATKAPQPNTGETHSPENDNRDHINVYSGGKSELGRLLSNFALSPVTIGGKAFSSLEAWWYWQSLVKQGVNIPAGVDELFSKVVGFKAKEFGKKLHVAAKLPVKAPSREELLSAYRAKVVANPKLAKMLAESTLPFDHYYVFSGTQKYDHNRWTGLLWEDVRSGLAQTPPPAPSAAPSHDAGLSPQASKRSAPTQGTTPEAAKPPLPITAKPTAAQPATPTPSAASKNDAGLLIPPLAQSVDAQRFTQDPSFDTAESDWVLSGVERLTLKQQQTYLQMVVDARTLAPAALFELVNKFAAIVQGSAKGLWRQSAKAVGISLEVLDALGTQFKAKRIKARHTLFHELGHALDYAGTDAHFTTASPQFAIDPKKITLVNGELVFEDGWAGPLLDEMYRVHQKAKAAKAQHPNHPLIANHAMERYGFHSLKDAVKANDAYLFAETQHEVFAQAHGLYWSQPTLLKAEAPQTYALFKDIYGDRNLSTFSVSELNQRVQRALRPPSAAQARGTDGHRAGPGTSPQNQPAGAGVQKPEAADRRLSPQEQKTVRFLIGKVRWDRRDQMEFDELSPEAQRQVNAGKYQTPFDSKRSTPTQGTTPEAFRQELSAKERKRLDAPNVHVLQRTTDAPFPVAPDTAGLYLPDGSVYFFTENIAPGEAFGKTVHELGAHYGLQRMVGKEVYDGILNQLQDMVKAEAGTFTSAKAAYARAKEAGASDEALWHETLAYLAEASPRHGLIRRLVHAIKRFLRSLGIPVGRLTEQDLVSLVQVAAFKEGLKGGGLSGEMLASKRSPDSAVIESYRRALPDGKIIQEWGIRRGSEWLGQGYATEAEAQPAFDYLTKRGSVTKDTREGVPAPNLTVDLRAQEKGRDIPVRQRPEPVRKDTPENLRTTPSMEGASPLYPEYEPALDVKPLTGKLGKLAAMMRGAKDRTRAISTSLALMLRSERKAPGVNVGALLELYRNALDTGRTEQAEPEEVAERQDATRKRLQKQRRAVALVTELRDAAQVVAAEEDQLAGRIKDFNAAKQRATKDPAFIKELQQSAQEAEQRVNAAKARAEALKTEEAALLNALKKPVARSVRNLTKRQQEAVAGLARDYPDLTDRLRAVTAWVSPTDLPLIDHLAKAIEAIDDYRHRDTSTLYDLDDVLMAEADDHLAARQVEARVRGEPGEGWQEQSMNVEAPTEGFYTLFKGQYFTQALAGVLSPLLKSTQRTEGELRQLWDQVTEALEGVGPIENTLFGLIEAANTMVPAQGTTLDAATRVVEMKLSDAEAWLNEDPDTTFGTLLLREVQAEGKKTEDPAYAKRNAHSNVGRFTRAMAGLRAWHDRYQVPYGQLYLQYDAKSQQFSITERMTSTNPNALEVFVDPHTGIATSLLEWVNDYLAQAAKNWKLPGKTGKETEFFRDNVLTLTPIDHITGKFTGKAQKADPLLKTDSQTGFIYVQGKSITQLGYALAQQQGLMTPENDYQAFMLARAALLDHANLALNTPELMDKNIARSAKEKRTFAQALAQEQGAREGRLPKATDKLLEPNTLGVAPAPSVVEGEAAFKKSLNAMDLAKREVFDPVYQKVYDTQIAKGKSEALAKKIATGRANEALRQHLLEQKDKERASDAWEYEGQWDLDSGTAPLDVAEKKQLAAAEEDAGKNQRLSKVEERIGATSTKATGNPQNLPVQEGGVFGQEGTEAHGLIQRALDALGFTKTRIHLYTSDQVEAYEAALKARNMTVWQGFTTRRERVKSIPAAVAFIQGEIFLYYDKSLTGETLREALSHELGHVVFRVMLNSERERNTPLWNRLFNEYQEADTGQRFMEWFADEAGRWINQRDQRVTNATQGFIKRIVDALKAMFRALGLRPAKGAVAAYMDGLALREKEQAYAEFQRALTGRIGQGYDLTTMQMAYHSRASERIHLRVSELDFITMDGVKRGTLAQAQRLLDAVPALQTAWNGTRSISQWAVDILSTANNFLREQNLAELTMHADVLDRGARQRVVEFTTNEQIDELLHDPEWSKLLGGVAEAKVQGLKDRANALRKKDWVAGVVLVKYKDRRTGTLEAEIRPIPQESFNAAIQRLYQGQWGSSDEGYRKLLHGKTEAEISEIGKELLRNDPKSETAKALAVWLKTFYKDYVVKGFTGAHSGTVHIGQQEDWGLARYYSPKAVEANLQAFIDLLTTTRKDEQGEVTWRGMQEGEAREFASHIITGQEAITEKDLDEAAGLVRPTLSPGAPSKQGRHITLPIEELLPFLETNADAVIARYTHSMIKRVEWEKRFGDEVQRGKHWVWQPDLYGQLTQAALINNHRDTLSANRMKYLLEKTRAINEAYLGRYGAYTTDPRVRAGMSWVQAVMNVLVMPLSLLSQAPDLAGPLTRMGGGTGAYAKGLRDAYRAMRDKGSDLWKVPEMYGIVYRDFRDSQAASFFDSQYLTTGPQKLNDWLFKWNGMQMFTNFSRLLSFHASGYWLEDLITGQHPDAERWLKDLGLTPSEVQQWVEGGKKEYTSADGEKSVAFKIMLARQRFVQESVFSPNVGQRPLLASHPYAMLVWHLKQFAFSFFTQILKPAYREVKKNPRLYGKMMAVLPLALMMPLALLGMGLRDELKYGEWVPWRGERPSFDQDPEGWLSQTGRIIGRTGVLGPLQLLIDANRQQSWGRSFTFALAGPAASKLEELFLADDTTEFITKALPGLSLLPAERAAFRSWVE